MKRIGILAALVVVLLSSCTTRRLSRQELSPLVRFERDAFEISEQKSASASVTKVFWIDWGHIFRKEIGSSGMTEIPIIGGLVRNNAEAEALYNLIKANPGYDVVLYPQFNQYTQSHILGIKYTRVTVTARMGKLKADE